MGSNATQTPWLLGDLNPCGQAVSKGPGSWCSVGFVQSSCLTWAQPKGCTSAYFLLAEITHVRGRGCVVSEASRKNCYLGNEKAQPITMLFLLQCYPKPPLCREQWGPSISSWLYNLVYSCLPRSPAACELVQLVVHSSPKSVSVLLCLLFSMFRLGKCYASWQFWGENREK